MQSDLELVVSALTSARLSASTEAHLHASIAEALTGAGIDHQHEVQLSKRDRIDFMAGPVGIEAKVQGSQMAFMRQLLRYSDHDEIKCLVLVSAKAVFLPSNIGGVPVVVVSVGMGWL